MRWFTAKTISLETEELKFGRLSIKNINANANYNLYKQSLDNELEFDDDLNINNLSQEKV